MEKKALRMTDKDNVATVLMDVKQGEEITIVSSDGIFAEKIAATQDIRFGFKVALEDIAVDERIIKYGAKIGTCYRQISKGDLVHIQNIKSDRIGIPQDRIDTMIKSMGI